MDSNSPRSESLTAATLLQRSLQEHLEAIQALLESSLGEIELAGALITATLNQGGKILLCGNGGSAADSQHIAAELVGRYELHRRAWPAIALTTDTSALTALSNDYGYEDVFARQVEALGKREDVALGISTSGRSPNVLMALEAVNAKGMKTIALTGRDGGVIGKAAGIHINVSHPSTARVQEVHRTVIHAICALVERAR